MKNIILIGVPGSGKGTQAEKLIQSHNFNKVVLGDILRECRKDKNHKFYTQINSLMDQGVLLPNDLVNQVAEEFVRNIGNKNGFLFDGYPRSVEQAEFVDNILKNNFNTSISCVVFLDISMESVISRLQNRYICSKCGFVYNKLTHNTEKNGVCDKCGHTEFTTRVDDSDINVIKTRFDEFLKKTMPVIDYYKGKILKIDATQSPEDVYQNIIQQI